ncbi:hypothetical protein RRF57_003900 [Xylaria bambusicola]|uniref:Alkaline ceramidase n=1 Tax=Xylaria bambusicola TaxID=326684 RepID=A0AAN7U966_9PEZI
MSAFSFPYHKPREGFWGEKTVTLNFCEEDYVMSYYCAEVCNTITNFLFLWLGVRGLKGCIQYGHPFIFFVTFIGYIIVGCGSTLFHATLKYPMQLVDELAMIYTTCFMAYATFSYGRSSGFSFALGTGLIGLAYYITAVMLAALADKTKNQAHYYETKDPQFHQDAYAILTATVVFSNMWIMERVLRPALKAREQKRSSRPSSSAVPSTRAFLSQMWIMVATGELIADLPAKCKCTRTNCPVLGLSIFLGGYLIWNLDNMYCNNIRHWRHQIQLPWSVVLEGHAWWHLMTGIGVSFGASGFRDVWMVMRIRSVYTGHPFSICLKSEPWTIYQQEEKTRSGSRWKPVFTLLVNHMHEQILALGLRLNAR